MRHYSIIQVFRWWNPTGQTEEAAAVAPLQKLCPENTDWSRLMVAITVRSWVTNAIPASGFFLLQHKEQASQTSMNGYVCHHGNHRAPLWCQFTDIDVHTLSPLIPLGRPADVPAALMEMYCLRWQYPIGCIMRGLLFMSAMVRVLQVEWNWQIIGPILPIIRYSIVLCDIPVLPKII